MKRQIFPTASKYRHRTRREFGGETVEYIIVILAVVVIGGGLMGFGNQVSGQIGKTGNSISSWFGKANGAGDNASGGNGTGGGNNAGGENKGDENSGSQLQAPTVSVTGMDVVGERVTAKVSNLPAGATQVSYQWWKYEFLRNLGRRRGLLSALQGDDIQQQRKSPRCLQRDNRQSLCFRLV